MPGSAAPSACWIQARASMRRTPSYHRNVRHGAVDRNISAGLAGQVRYSSVPPPSRRTPTTIDSTANSPTMPVLGLIAQQLLHQDLSVYTTGSESRADRRTSADGRSSRTIMRLLVFDDEFARRSPSLVRIRHQK